MVEKLGVTIEREKCNQVEHDLQERIKELQCLYGIAEVAERPEIRLDELYQEVVNLLPSSWQYPEITCARITIDNKKFNSKNFIDTNWKQSSDIKVHRAKVGTLEVGYIEARLELDEGPFLKEERQLIDAAAKLVSTITEHKQADEKVKDRLVLENSISQASRLFACQHDVDIKEVLRILGEAMSVNRAYIFQFRQNSRKIENTHEWCAPGTEPQIDNLQDLNPALVPWWMKKLVNSENIVIPDVDSLPAEAAT